MNTDPAETSSDSIPHHEKIFSGNSLRTDEGEPFTFRTPDDLELQLTRCRGGEKGPVLLSHCIGVSSRIYSTPLLSTNLLAYLYNQNYDVWLLDFRFSIDLPTSKESHPMDAVAQHDYPAAVEKVREVTGAESVQVVAHGVGASTLTMSLLTGLEGVRSAVFSQVSTHLIIAPLAQIAAHLRANQFMKLLGYTSLTPEVPGNPGLFDRVINYFLDRYPLEEEEDCDNPVCHRITGMYGLMWEHDQLSVELHNGIDQLFGHANLVALAQLALMGRTRHIVNQDGEETYLPNLDRLDLPALFLHGSDNMCVLPKSTAMTIKRLQRTNSPDLYRRLIIPGYGHVDCILGKNAHRDVFPHILEHLEQTARRNTERTQ